MNLTTSSLTFCKGESGLAKHLNEEPTNLTH